MLRLPNDWNGKLVVTGAPGTRRQFAADYRTAFAAFENWIERGQAPPPSQTVARTAGGDVANACPLAGGAGAVMTRRPVRPGLRRAVVRKRGKRTATVRIRVLRRR
jgi:hypothetical protein